jgi:hypothetical protein
MESMPRALFVAGLLAAGLLLASCANEPLPAPPPPGPAPEAMVASIRAAAGSAEDELAVQPLRDSMVEGLRDEAAQRERAHDYAGAAAALDQALAVTPEDPAVLQERAEAAVLLREFAAAEAFAHKAWTLGAQVGPLCRRHWATIEQVRLARADAAGARSARTQLEACTVGAPPRY